MIAAGCEKSHKPKVDYHNFSRGEGFLGRYWNDYQFVKDYNNLKEEINDFNVDSVEPNINHSQIK